MPKLDVPSIKSLGVQRKTTKLERTRSSRNAITPTNTASFQFEHLILYKDLFK